jgi:hypothetical protein
MRRSRARWRARCVSIFTIVLSTQTAAPLLHASRDHAPRARS